MKCPVDETTLEKHKIHSIDIEGCPRCRGLWFEKGELQDMKDIEEFDLRWMDFELWSDQNAFDAQWSSRPCPVCNKNMAAILYANTEVTVDYCVDEHGIWLDKGEFEKIIDSLQHELITMSLPEYIAASLEEAKEIISGDEGFVHEWKDFSTVMRFLQYRILAENPKLADVLTALSRSLPY